MGRRYFSQLDRLTNPAYGAVDGERVRAIQGLLETLKHRVLMRGALHPNRLSKLPSYSRVGVLAISKLMNATMQEVFGTPLTSPSNLETIGATHDLFSWGGLRTPQTRGIRTPNNIPDSAMIFFFPEFAHLAIELGFDAVNWSALLPMLTRMPALYVAAHELHDAEWLPKPFDELGPPPSCNPFEIALIAHASKLRKEYELMGKGDLEQVLGKLAAKAFDDVGDDSIEHGFGLLPKI